MQGGVAEVGSRDSGRNEITQDGDIIVDHVTPVWLNTFITGLAVVANVPTVA